MKNNIIIKNQNIANYVMFRLDKIDNIFLQEELDNIDELTVDCSEDINIEEIILFRNLKTLNIRNAYINNSLFNDIFKLKLLNNLYFEKCKFENILLIPILNVEGLSLINCDIENYSFIVLMTNLKELTIINGNINLNKINLLSKLTYLQLSYSNIINEKKELNLNYLKELYIDNTNINDLTFTKELSYLELLSIDEKQYLNNKMIINDLIKKEILVYKENMIELNGDENEI